MNDENKLGDWQDEQMSLVAAIVDHNTERLCAMLNRINRVFSVSKDGNWVIAPCPRCGDKAKAKVRDRNEHLINWRCFKCGVSKELNSSLVGLVRLFTGLPMTKAGNKLFESAFSENRPSDYRLPDNIGQYSGKRLDEISAADLFYLSKKGTAPALTAEVKQAINQYLLANVLRESGPSVPTRELPPSVPKNAWQRPAFKR